MTELTEEQILWKALKYACNFESNYSTREIETEDLANYYYQRAKADLLAEKLRCSRIKGEEGETE